jgi:hypothetical protein
MGVYHCDVCGRSVAAEQLCILQRKYCRHQHTQRTCSRAVAAKPAREAGLCPLSCVEQTVFPSHFQRLQLPAKPIMKMTVNYIQDVNMKVSNSRIKHHTMWCMRSGELAPNINLCIRWRWEVSFTPRPIYLRGKDLCTQRFCPSKYGCVPQNIIRNIWQHEM